jgi:hypothetical protein
VDILLFLELLLPLILSPLTERTVTFVQWWNYCWLLAATCKLYDIVVLQISSVLWFAQFSLGYYIWPMRIPQSIFMKEQKMCTRPWCSNYSIFYIKVRDNCCLQMQRWQISKWNVCQI